MHLNLISNIHIKQMNQDRALALVFYFSVLFYKYLFRHFFYLWLWFYCRCFLWEELAVEHMYSCWRYNWVSISIIDWAFLSLYYPTSTGISMTLIMRSWLSREMWKKIFWRWVILIFLMLFLMKLMMLLLKWIMTMRFKRIILFSFRHRLKWIIPKLKWIFLLLITLFIKVDLRNFFRRVLRLYFGWF